MRNILVYLTLYLAMLVWRYKQALGTFDLSGYFTAGQLTNRAMANINITKPREKLTDHDIRLIIRWIGVCSSDTIFVDSDKPRLGRIGINNMLFTTLMEFPGYYMKYGLAQFN